MGGAIGRTGMGSAPPPPSGGGGLFSTLGTLGQSGAIQPSSAPAQPAQAQPSAIPRPTVEQRQNFLSAMRSPAAFFGNSSPWSGIQPPNMGNSGGGDQQSNWTQLLGSLLNRSR